MQQSPPAARPDRFGEDTAPHRTAVSALFAADGRSAVVLRRGPRLHNRLIRWNLGNDTFTPGQWMKGTVHLYDLDPSGQKLLYWARQWHMSAPRRDEDAAADGAGYDPLGPPLRRRAGHEPHGTPVSIGQLKGRLMRPRRNEGVWTALSTPPYFTALAIWPCHGHWTGGGWFDGPDTLVLQEDARGLVPKINGRLPDWLTLTVPHRLGFDRPPGTATRPVYVDPHRASRFDTLAATFRRQGVRWVEWFHIVGRDLLFAADGQLFRLEDYARVSEEAVLEAARVLIDLRPMRFELIAAPEAALIWRGQRPKDKRLRSRR